MPEDINVITLGNDYEYATEKINKMKIASSDLVKGIEKDLDHLKKLTAGIGKRASGALFGGFSILQASEATSLRGLAESHKGGFEFQAVGKSIKGSGQLLGKVNTTSPLLKKGLGYTSRGLTGAGEFMDMSLLKMYTAGLESLAATGTKTASVLVRAFTPLKILFNPIVGGILMAGDAMLSFHEKTVQSREELEKYTKNLSDFYQVAEKGAGTLKTSQTAIAGTSGVYGKALGISGKETTELLGKGAVANFSITGSEQLLKIAAAVSREQGKELSDALDEVIQKAKGVTGYMTTGTKEKYLEEVAARSGADYQFQRYRGTSLERSFERAGGGMKSFETGLTGIVDTFASALSGRTAYEPGVIAGTKSDLSRAYDIFKNKIEEASPFARGKKGIAGVIESVGGYFGDIGAEQIRKNAARAKANVTGEPEKEVKTPVSDRAKGVLESIFGSNSAFKLFSQIGTNLGKAGAEVYGIGRPGARAGTDLLEKNKALYALQERQAADEAEKRKKELEEAKVETRFVTAKETKSKLGEKVGEIDKRIATALEEGRNYALTKEEESIKKQYKQAVDYLEKNKGLAGTGMERVISAYAKLATGDIGGATKTALFQSERGKRLSILTPEEARTREEEAKRRLEEVTKRGEEAKRKRLGAEVGLLERISPEQLEASGRVFRKEGGRALQEKEEKIGVLLEKIAVKSGETEVYRSELGKGTAGRSKEQLVELDKELEGLKHQLAETAKSAGQLEGAFNDLSASKLFERTRGLESRKAEYGVASALEQGVLSKRDIADIKEARGDLSKPMNAAAREAINRITAIAQEEFQTNLNFAQLGAQSRYERGTGKIQVESMRRRGVPTAETPVESRKIEQEAVGGTGVLRKQAQTVLSIREQMYEQEIEFTRRYAQTASDIIKTHYDNVVNIERTKLYGSEVRNQNAVGLGSQLLQGGRERAGIEMQVFQNLNNLLQEKRTERGFKEAGVDMLFGIAGQQLPPEVQMIRGLRNLREQRQDFENQRAMQTRRERTEGESSYRSMRTLKRFGYGEKELGQSESGLNFMLQAYQQAIPDIARRSPELLRNIQERMQQFIGQKEELATRRFIGEERIKGVEEKSTKEQIGAFEREVAAKGGEKADVRLRADLAQKYAEAAASAGRRGDLEAQGDYIRKQEAILKTLPDEMKKNFGDKQAQMVEYLKSQVDILKAIREGITKLGGGTTSESVIKELVGKSALGEVPGGKIPEETPQKLVDKKDDKIRMKALLKERDKIIGSGELGKDQDVRLGEIGREILNLQAKTKKASEEWTNDKKYGPLRGFSATVQTDEERRMFEEAQKKIAEFRKPKEEKSLYTPKSSQIWGVNEFSAEGKWNSSTKQHEKTLYTQRADSQSAADRWARRGEDRFVSQIPSLTDDQKQRRQEAENIASVSRARVEAIRQALPFEDKWWENVPKSKGGEGPEIGDTDVSIPKDTVTGTVDSMDKSINKFGEFVDDLTQNGIKVTFDDQGRPTAKVGNQSSAIAGY